MRHKAPTSHANRTPRGSAIVEIVPELARAQHWFRVGASMSNQSAPLGVSPSRLGPVGSVQRERLHRANESLSSRALPARLSGSTVAYVTSLTFAGSVEPANVGARIDLVALQTFVVTAENGTQRRAAEKLHITSQAVGGHLKRLERDLGVVLFDRGSRGSPLTSSGREILEHARRILKSSTRLVEFAENITSGDAGSISIACYPVHVERMLGEVLGRFHDKLPGVRIDLSQMRDDRRRGWGKSLFEELRDGEVDVAIGPRHDGPEYGLAGCHLYLAAIVAMVPDSHPDRFKKAIPINALAQQPLLIAPDGFFSRQRVAQAAQDAGFELSVAFQSSNPPALLALGSHGLGVPVIADDYPLVGQQRYPYPVIQDKGGIPIQTEVWMHWREAAPKTPAMDAFISITREVVDEERELGKKYQEYYRAEMIGRERRQEPNEGTPDD